MIVLDTHIWIWWASELPDLKPRHRDPADEIIVATARMLNVPLLTADRKLLDYEHVTKLT